MYQNIKMLFIIRFMKILFHIKCNRKDEINFYFKNYTKTLIINLFTIFNIK